MDSYSKFSAVLAALGVLGTGLGATAPVLAAPQARSGVDLFIDFAGDGLAGAMAVGTAPSGIAIDGVPLKLGIAEGPAEQGWRMVTGARARYGMALDNGFDVIARGGASRTTFLDDPLQDRAVATGAAEFRLRRGDWRFGLTPGIAATRWATGGLHRDGTIDARLARPLTDAIGFTATSRYRYRLAEGGESFHSEAVGGRVGLTCQLSDLGHLDIAYAARRETWSHASGYGGPEASFARGPLFSLAVPLDSALGLKASYSFTETTSTPWSDAEAAMQAAGTTDGRHQLDLALTWDVGGARSDLALAFAYRFERASPEIGGGDTRHVGTVNLALGF